MFSDRFSNRFGYFLLVLCSPFRIFFIFVSNWSSKKRTFCRKWLFSVLLLPISTLFSLFSIFYWSHFPLINQKKNYDENRVLGIYLCEWVYSNENFLIYFVFPATKRLGRNFLLSSCCCCLAVEFQISLCIVSESIKVIKM